MMVIKYKKSKLKAQMYMGILWGILAILGTIFSESGNFFLKFGFYFLAIFYFAQYLYDRKYQYLRIENNIVSRYLIPRKKFDLSHLSRINRNTNGIRLVSESINDLQIHTSIIDEESLRELNLFLEKIESVKN